MSNSKDKKDMEQIASIMEPNYRKKMSKKDMERFATLTLTSAISESTLHQKPTPEDLLAIAEQRRKVIRQMKAEGMTHKEIAAKFDVTTRTIARWLNG